MVTITIKTLLVWLALICFILAAASAPVPRVNLIGLGLAFLTLGVWLVA